MQLYQLKERVNVLLNRGFLLKREFKKERFEEKKTENTLSTKKKITFKKKIKFKFLLFFFYKFPPLDNMLTIKLALNNIDYLYSCL